MKYMTTDYGNKNKFSKSNQLHFIKLDKFIVKRSAYKSILRMVLRICNIESMLWSNSIKCMYA